MQDIDKEKLRAFEQKMHDEGADGFADGPRPWETWDESGAQAPGTGRHVWEGKARRIYKSAPVPRSIGERILSGLAMIALATMVVGIAGVYLTEEQPQTVAWTAIQPTPIPLPEQRETTTGQRLPARMQRPAPVIAEIESLPPPAAGRPAPEIDKSATKMPAPALTSLTGTDSEPARDAPAIADSTVAAATGEDPLDTPAGNPDIEIVTTPAALLLTSTTGSPADDSNEVPGDEIDPALAMEIATAPSVDTDTGAAPAAAIGNGGNVAVTGLPARDFINRGTASDKPAAPDSTLAETAGTTAGLADTAELDTTLDSISGKREPAQIDATTTAPATAGSQTLVVTDEVTVLEDLAPAEASPATTDAAAAGRDDMSGMATDRAAGIPAGDDMAAQDMPAASDSSLVALAEPEPAIAAPAPAAAAAAVPSGGWVVNLATYSYEPMARKKLAEFQAKGVNGEIERAVINDRTMYRIRVAGFASSRSARAGISSLEATLGLKGAWVARR